MTLLLHLLVLTCSCTDSDPIESASPDTDTSSTDSDPPGDSGDATDTQDTAAEPEDDPICQVAGKPVDVVPSMDLADRLPVLGEATELSVALLGRSDLIDQGYETVTISLCLRPDGGAAAVVAGPVEHPLTEPLLEAQDWIPPELGLYEVWAVIRLEEGSAILTDTREMFATQSRLHFNFWSYQDDQRWATSILMPESEDEEKEWQYAGVQVLDWAWGFTYPEELTAEEYATMWQDFPGRLDGFVVDEFGSGEPIDQVMGEALQRVEEAQPELFIAAYSTGLVGDQMIAGFEAADLVMAETYAADWRGYNSFDDRYGPFVTGGVDDHGLAVVGLYLATHLREVRQQVAYVRTVFPDMPGLAFFSEPRSEHLGESIDQVLWDYYLGPALLPVVDGQAVSVRNLGSLPARDVVVIYEDEEGQELSRSQVESIDAGATAILDALGDAAGVRLLEAPEKYTVIEYVDPTTLPPPDADRTLAAETWRDALLTSKDVVTPFSGRPALTVSVNEEGETEQATLDLPSAAADGVVVLSFDLQVTEAWFYGSVGVGVGNDDASLGLSLGRGDDDNDLPGDSPRLILTWQGADGMTVTDISPPGLVLGEVYTITAAYEPSGTIRVLLFDSAGALLWDSDALAVNGPLDLDRLVLDVRDGPNSVVEWDPDSDLERARLFGTGESPYAIEAWVSGVEVWASWVP